MTLADLHPGDAATVTGYAADVPERVLELGLLPGTAVTLVRRAPLGDPLELRVRGFHLSLRLAEARLVEVTPDA
ncbi:MAG: ferrous iron transport protein A [Rhodothermales bacterium]|nr:ferrous iron transport protein A [Rhodothermales bacterium]